MNNFTQDLEKDILNSKIYIVDDNISNVVLLENILELAGFVDIWSTTNELELKEKLDAEKPDLLLLDLMMPKISGFEFLKDRQKSNSSNTFYPVIVLTADTTSKAKKLSLELGASDFITKPFDFNEVTLRVKNHLTTKLLLDLTLNQNEILEEKVRTKTKKLLIANETARKNELKYRLLFDATLDSILIFPITTEEALNFIECNPASEKNLGYSKEELLQMNNQDLIFNYSPEKYKYIREGLSENKAQFVECDAVTKNGDVRNMEIQIVPDHLDGINVGIMFMKDVTEQNKYFNSILRQNETLKEIAWIQSHIVRAPLSRMMGIINLVEDPEIEKEELGDYLKLISKSAEELDQVIRDISEKAFLALETPSKTTT